jgi:flagellar hook-length control protein FliK
MDTIALSLPGNIIAPQGGPSATGAVSDALGGVGLKSGERPFSGLDSFSQLLTGFLTTTSQQGLPTVPAIGQTLATQEAVNGDGLVPSSLIDGLAIDGTPQPGSGAFEGSGGAERGQRWLQAGMAFFANALPASAKDQKLSDEVVGFLDDLTQLLEADANHAPKDSLALATGTDPTQNEPVVALDSDLGTGQTDAITLGNESLALPQNPVIVLQGSVIPLLSRLSAAFAPATGDGGGPKVTAAATATAFTNPPAAPLLDGDTDGNLASAPASPALLQAQATTGGNPATEKPGRIALVGFIVANTDPTAQEGDQIIPRLPLLARKAQTEVVQTKPGEATRIAAAIPANTPANLAASTGLTATPQNKAPAADAKPSAQSPAIAQTNTTAPPADAPPAPQQPSHLLVEGKTIGPSGATSKRADASPDAVTASIATKIETSPERNNATPTAIAIASVGGASVQAALTKGREAPLAAGPLRVNASAPAASQPVVSALASDDNAVVADAADGATLSSPTITRAAATPVSGQDDAPAATTALPTLKSDDEAVSAPTLASKVATRLADAVAHAGKDASAIDGQAVTASAPSLAEQTGAQAEGEASDRSSGERGHPSGGEAHGEISSPAIRTLDGKESGRPRLGLATKNAPHVTALAKNNDEQPGLSTPASSLDGFEESGVTNQRMLAAYRDEGSQRLEDTSVQSGLLAASAPAAPITRPRAETGPAAQLAETASKDSLLSEAIVAKGKANQAGTETSGEEQANSEALLHEDASRTSLLPHGAEGKPSGDFSLNLKSVEHPQRPRPHAPPPLPQQVAFFMQRAAQEGQERISIQLRPVDLGRIDVQLEFSHDGALRARVVAESAQTLDMLQKDSRQLEKALQQAGVQTDGNSLSFSLRDPKDQGQSDRKDQGQQGTSSNGTKFADEVTGGPEAAVASANPAPRSIISEDKIDVTI